VQAYRKKLNRELDEATKDMKGGIDEFEKNLQKQGIELNTDPAEAKKKMEERKNLPWDHIPNFSYAATMNKIKESKNLGDFACKERDRRRRKMQVDQARIQSDIEKKKQEEQLIAKLTAKNKEEQEEAYQRWRTEQCKALDFENRRQRAEI